MAHAWSELTTWTMVWGLALGCPALMVVVAWLWVYWPAPGPRYATVWLRWFKLAFFGATGMMMLNCALIAGAANMLSDQVAVVCDAHWRTFEPMTRDRLRSLVQQAEQDAAAIRSHAGALYSSPPPPEFPDR